MVVTLQSPDLIQDYFVELLAGGQS